MKLTANNLTKLLTSSIRNEGLLGRVSNLLIVTAIATCASIVNAGTPATDDESNSQAYVDSIHQWGPWELDIEPAAGGLKAESAGPLSARESTLSLRTNSISALSPPQPISAIPVVPVAPVIPVVPVVPVIPTPPTAPPVPTAPGGFAPPGAT